MSSTKITKELMSEYYQRVYPTGLLTRWLRYGDDSGFMGRREFCFTLVGDIFTRFRSYSTEAALKAELVRSGPEKIDIGAIYNTNPDRKATVQITPEERELVFDIDMSDYDTIRSCCSGKQVCVSCWTWMATAARILRDIMERDMGYSLMLPVFSGRRGIHLWVLDPAARKLSDEERSGIVGYCTVITEKENVNVLAELRWGNLHPTMHRVHRDIIHPNFEKLFLKRTVINGDGTLSTNMNCIFESSKAAKIVYDLLLSLEPHFIRPVNGKPAQRKFAEKYSFSESDVFSDTIWEGAKKAVGDECIVALEFALMYPRLDEKVSTRRDHLLKLPFCIHPGTGRLCVPLEWDDVDTFDPKVDPPSIDHLLHESGAIDPKWTAPLEAILTTLEAQRVKQELKAEPAMED